MPYYAVRVGRIPGIYRSWNECQSHTKGYSNAEFKRFNDMYSAEQYLTRSSRVLHNSYLSNSSNQPPQTLQNSYLPNSSNQYQSNQSPQTYSHSPYLLNSSNQYQYNQSPQILQNSYLPNQSSKIILYTDGSCRYNGSPNAIGGYGIYSPTNPDLTSYGPISRDQTPTNQRAELIAILTAIDSVPHGSHIQIITDSMYSINCITNWSIKWERRGWNVDKANLDLIKSIIYTTRSKRLSIEYNHVLGHRGDYGNEEADRLANLGTDMNYIR